MLQVLAPRVACSLARAVWLRRRSAGWFRSAQQGAAPDRKKRHSIRPATASLVAPLFAAGELVVVLLRLLGRRVKGVLWSLKLAFVLCKYLRRGFCGRGLPVLAQLFGFRVARRFGSCAAFGLLSVRRFGSSAGFGFRRPTLFGSVQSTVVAQQWRRKSYNSSTTRRCTRPPTAPFVSVAGSLHSLRFRRRVSLVFCVALFFGFARAIGAASTCSEYLCSLVRVALPSDCPRRLVPFAEQGAPPDRKKRHSIRLLTA